MKKMIEKMVSFAVVLILLVALSMTLPRAGWSQSASPTDDLVSWLKTQQAQVGMAETLKGHKNAATWWDAFSLGQKGLNVGAAGAADFFDAGPSITGTNSDANNPDVRYGAATVLHAGNIWNWAAGKLPEGIASHVHLVTLPNVVVGVLCLYPHGVSIDKWRFDKDFMPALAYRFGGS